MRKFQRGSPLQNVDEVPLAIRRAGLQAEKGNVDVAIESLSSLLARYPTRIEILTALARILIQATRYADAVDVLSVLKAHLPGNFEILRMSGQVLFEVRAFDQAREDLLAALQIKPDDGIANTTIARLYETLGDDENAATYTKRAVKSSPTMESACHAVGLLLHAGRPEEAQDIIAEFPRQISASPEMSLTQAMTMPVIPASLEEIQSSRNQLLASLKRAQEQNQRLENPVRDLRVTNFQLGYHGMEDRDLIEETAKTLLQLAPDLAYVCPNLQTKPASGRRLKVGFVSANMRHHSVGRVLNRFLKELDRTRFEVLLFELPGKYGGGQEVARGYADRTIPVPGQLDQARKTIEAEIPDILCFPDFVMDSFTDYLSYSRLAPVQFSTWGHPGTSGRPSIDYWVSCQDWEPPGNERLYSEKLVRFNSPPMIATRLDPPPNIFTRNELGLPEGRLYGCPQSLYKLHPEFDAYFGEILTRDAEGYLVLIGGLQPRWIEVFKQRIAKNYPNIVDRLVILPRIGTNRYLSVLHHCAVSLDPIHFGGANTSMEAFTMGLPVVTQPGDQLRNRQTLSFYRMMGYPDLIVDTKEAYVELSLKLAQDQDFREEASKQVQSRCGVLFDTVEVTRDLESFMESSAKEAIGG